ncbi:MAG: hypothetical protein IPP42_05265 [Saprospiraceae bacterium]|nr:hypothetical protein [Saprospiraceae bacterium]
MAWWYGDFMITCTAPIRTRYTEGVLDRLGWKAIPWLLAYHRHSGKIIKKVVKELEQR